MSKHLSPPLLLIMLQLLKLCQKQVFKVSKDKKGMIGVYTQRRPSSIFQLWMSTQKTTGSHERLALAWLILPISSFYNEREFRIVNHTQSSSQHDQQVHKRHTSLTKSISPMQQNSTISFFLIYFPGFKRK